MKVALTFLLASCVAASAQINPMPVKTAALVVQPGYSVTLAWNHSPSTNATSYRIYYGPSSGHYTNSAFVGYTTNAVMTGMGVPTFFAAVAVADDGEESIYSNEAIFYGYENVATLYVQTNGSPNGVFKDAFPALTNKVVGNLFYRLRIANTNRLIMAP